MNYDEKRAAILAAARRNPQGLERDALLREAGVPYGAGYKMLTQMRLAEEIGFVRGDRASLWALPEHLSNLNVAEHCKPGAVRRIWPIHSAWTPPQPRIPSVWHLGQL